MQLVDKMANLSKEESDEEGTGIFQVPNRATLNRTLTECPQLSASMMKTLTRPSTPV